MWRFGAFEADPESGELRENGRRVALQEKPFQLLLALVEQSGRVVTRDALRQRLWPDVVVDFDGNLNAAARKLREALGDSASEPRFVETVPRRGYRFIARLAAPPEPPRTASPRFSAAGLKVAALAGIMATVGLVGFLVGWLRPAPQPPAPQPHALQPHALQPHAERVMLAVMPFDNLSGDASQDYISDGFTEELLTALGRLQPERLGVIARITAMTYKGTTQRIDEIGRELGVDYVLEGSVRGSAERSRITAQLIAVDDQTHLWAETYDSDGDDLLATHAEVARRISHALAGALLADDPLAAARTATTVPAAYDHYLRGRHQWHRFSAEGNRYAVDELSQAVALDPAYAEAHAALADAYNLQAFDKGVSPVASFARARAAAERALELDPDLAAGHNALAFATLYGDYDAVTADPLFRRARELDPNHAMAYHWHAGALAALGRYDEAVAAVRRAHELDPLASSVQSDLGWYLLFAGRAEEAISECRATLELHPGHGWATACLVEGLILAGDTAAAVRHAVRHQRDQGTPFAEPVPSDLPSLLRALHAREMARDEADGDAVYRAILEARLGRFGAAVDQLELAYDRREAWLVFLYADPRLAALRGHPDFEALAARLRIRAAPARAGRVNGGNGDAAVNSDARIAETSDAAAISDARIVGKPDAAASSDAKIAGTSDAALISDARIVETSDAALISDARIAGTSPRDAARSLGRVDSSLKHAQCSLASGRFTLNHAFSTAKRAPFDLEDVPAPSIPQTLRSTTRGAS
ncbi:MAG: winged helix-turn-helix domain-containing protein [Acidobacteriota bacterium]